MKMSNRMFVTGSVVFAACLMSLVSFSTVSASATNTQAGVIFSSSSPVPVDANGHAVLTVSMQNTNTVNSKTINYNQYTCRCKESAGSPATGDPNFRPCDAYWPNQPVGSLTNWQNICHVLPGTTVLAPGETKQIQFGVTQFNNMYCGSMQLDMNLLSINGVTFPNPTLVAFGVPHLPTDCVLPAPVCSTNSDCGTDGYTGSPTCQGGNVYQSYTTNVCINPGTPNARCTVAPSLKLKTTCGANQTCSNGSCTNVTVACSTNSQCGTNTLVGNPFCQGNAVYQNYKTFTCNNAGTASSTCSNATAPQLQNNCTGNQTCSNGSCSNASVTCSTNSQCGTNTLVGNPFCQGNSVYQNYKAYTCNNPGAANSTCSDSTTPQLQNNCTGNQTCSNGTCSNATVNCSTNSQCGTNALVGSPFCQGNSVYQNYKTYTCNNAGTANSTCSDSTTPQLQSNCTGNQTCSGGSCTNATVTCSTNSQCGTNGVTGSPFCQGNGVYQNYQTYTCNNPGTANSNCSTSTTTQLQNTCVYGQTCNGGTCNTQVNTCTNHSYQQCSGNGVYWFDSCGHQQELAQACTGNQTCSGNTCINTTTTCTYHAYQQCSGSSVHWFDSCGTDQGVSQFCSGNQTCSGSTCIGTTNTCTYHASQRCLGNAVYWFDSCGTQQDLVQVCSGNQTCSGNICTGTTVQGSLLITETVRNLSSGNLNWSSSVNANPSDVLQFQIVISSTGSQYANNVVVRDVLPANLIYNNNLTVDGISNSGNIVSGLNIGSVSAGQTRIVTYQVQVAGASNFAFGTTTLSDASTVTADNGVASTGSASVIVTRGSVLGATTVSTGLTNNPFVDSFFIPLLIALMGIWLYKSGIVKMPAWATANQLKNKELSSQKKLESKIAEIKEKETAIA